MDIQYLLALQGLRESLPSPVELFFVLLSYIGDGPGLVALVLVVYWCVDKRSGQFAFIAFGAANFVSQLLKNIVCVYRPWIRDAAIAPGMSSLPSPSGRMWIFPVPMPSFRWSSSMRSLKCSMT